MIFFSSAHCTSGAHCGYCRLKTHKSGVEFRQDKADNWDDVTEVDFECPHGLPWVADEEAHMQAMRDNPKTAAQVAPRQNGPGIFTKAMSFTVAIAKALAHCIMLKKPIADREERAHRKSVCQGDGGHPRCEFFNKRTCEHCGCNLPFKIVLKTEVCPIGKWKRMAK